jgi:hypothetical protein
MPEHATVTRPRPRTAPIGPRRVSGPSRRAIPAGPAIRQRGGTSAFEKLSRIPDHRVIDRLLRGRACILIIGLMLGGIVAMQVSLLRMNSGISNAVLTKNSLSGQNMLLEKQIAQTRSGDGVGEAAAGIGMIDPPAGERRFVSVRPTDAARAARRMKPPSQRSILVMDNGGYLPGSLAVAGTPAAALAAELNGQPAPTPVPGAVATATPPAATTSTAPAPTATPVVPAPTATPVVPAPTAAPPVSTAPAATAPQG